MNYLLFASVFSLFGIVYFIIGWQASKNIFTNNDYFLAGKNLGIVSVAFTLIATQLGSGMLLGTPQEAYKTGFYGILYILGMSLGFILLASGFASRLQALNVSTTAEIFQTKYSSKILKQIASLLSIITTCGILIGQVVAIKMVLASLGINSEGLLVLFWLFVVGYTMLGGLKAVVWTDIFQVAFIIVIFGFLTIYALWTEPAGWFANIVQAHKTSVFQGSFLAYDKLFPFLIVPALFSLIEQDLAQRFFASKNKRTAMLSALYASLFMLAFAFVPLYFGMKAKLMGIAVPVGTNPLVMVLQFLTGDFIFVLAMCGVVAAITSTADSLLCAISSNIAQDFDFSFLRKFSGLTLSKIITFIVGIVALLLSYFMPQNIITIITNSYKIMVNCLFVPTIFALFKKKLVTQAAIYSVAFGGIVFGLTMLIDFGVSGEFLPLLASFVGYLAGELVSCKCAKQIS